MVGEYQPRLTLIPPSANCRQLHIQILIVSMAFEWISLREITERAAKSEEQDQTAHIWELILYYTVSAKINTRSQTTG